MTWKTKVSKANVLLFQLQASVHGIKGNESGLWLTPTATDMSVRSEEAMEKRKEYRSKIGRKTVPPGSLSEQVMYGKPTKNMYPTPVVSDHLHNQSESIENWTKRAEEKKKQGINLHFALRHHVQMYPTPRAADVEGGAVKNVQLENGHFFRENKKGVRWGVKLRDAVEMYPTPTTRDHKDSTLSPAYKNRNSDSLPIKMMKEGKPGGRLNPNFVELLMGYPMNWTKIDPTE
jgi:hypothetical protein